MKGSAVADAPCNSRCCLSAASRYSFADALALSGCDYLVLTAKVMGDLEATPTLQGYNSGLSAAATSEEDGIERMLSPAAAAASDLADMGPISESQFNEMLGPCGKELLQQGLAGLVRDVETVLPYFKAMATGQE
jgi:transaldolase